MDWENVNRDVGKYVPIHARFRQKTSESWEEGTLVAWFPQSPYRYKDSFGKWWVHCQINKAQREQKKAERET